MSDETDLLKRVYDRFNARDMESAALTAELQARPCAINNLHTICHYH
jgi:hypothetical protein